MCWQCDHPGSTRQDYLDHMQDLIDRFGWAVVGVERDRVRPPWAYTLGLTQHGRPELVLTGLPLPRATWLLNAVAPYVLDTAVPQPGEAVHVEGGPLMEVVRVAEPAAHLTIAVELYGPGIRALQLVYADDRGHWPWDAGFRGRRGGQPVLGVRAIPPTRAAGEGDAESLGQSPQSVRK
jgi:Domain of unknown function (DUF4262)